MQHVEVSRITGDPRRMADAVSYLTSEVRPVMDRQPGNLGTSLLLAPETGAAGFESFWASNGALLDSGDVIAASVRETAGGPGNSDPRALRGPGVRAGGTAARRAGRAGDTDGRRAVKAVGCRGCRGLVRGHGGARLADASGFCAALLYADWASGHVISETVWHDPQALAASRGTAAAGEAAAAEALTGVISASAGYQLVFSSARPA
jgi:hypothetical protein